MVSFEPLKVQSLKESCVRRLEGLILSGELKIGERLPSERELASRLNISRPVLHEALVDLNAKGLVRIVPRRGVFINDYRREGSLTLLSSLLNFQNGQLDPLFQQSLIDMRLTLECETARLAALNRTPEQVGEFYSLLQQETEADRCDASRLTELDFAFHHLVAIASGNVLYPLVINSFRGVYTSLTSAFFRRYCGTPVVGEVLDYHRRLTGAIEMGNSRLASAVMAEMLKHGEHYLKAVTPIS
ncbi:MAG: FadR/GntR family transcriptional regulator [Anaerolineales bacterium]|jgi:DNA-binding FadR family transcriptional regulator